MASQSFTLFIADEVSAADRAQFKQLWQEHLKLRDQGKIVYFLPHNMGTKLGCHVLQEIAKKLRYDDKQYLLKHFLTTLLSISLETDVYIHFDTEKLAYRIGQIFDDTDRQATLSLVFVYEVEFSKLYNPTSFITSPALTSPGKHHDFDVNSVAAQGDPALSEQKAGKIPKPRNMWIIYRQEKHKTVLAENPGMHTSSICKWIVRFNQGHKLTVCSYDHCNYVAQRVCGG